MQENFQNRNVDARAKARGRRKSLCFVVLETLSVWSSQFVFKSYFGGETSGVGVMLSECIREWRGMMVVVVVVVWSAVEVVAVAFVALVAWM